MTNEPNDTTPLPSPDADDSALAPERHDANVEQSRPGDRPILQGVDRGGTGEPVGRDNIREGRVGGVLGGPHPSQGQGQGG